MPPSASHASSHRLATLRAWCAAADVWMDSRILLVDKDADVHPLPTNDNDNDNDDGFSGNNDVENLRFDDGGAGYTSGGSQSWWYLIQACPIIMRTKTAHSSVTKTSFISTSTTSAELYKNVIFNSAYAIVQKISHRRQQRRTRALPFRI